MGKKITYLFLLFSFFSSGQRIQNFNAYAAGNSVAIRFTVSKGTQCSGYTIWHSLDSIFFNQIYNYPGTCGDISNDIDYSYTHSSPALNQTNYYKVELIPVETSTVRRIYILGQPQLSLVVFPNPVVNIYDVLNIKILNSSNVRVIGFLYNQFGKPIREIDLTTQVDLASIYINDLSNGLYVIWLTDGTRAYSSKFIVNR